MNGEIEGGKGKENHESLFLCGDTTIHVTKLLGRTYEREEDTTKNYGKLWMITGNV